MSSVLQPSPQLDLGQCVAQLSSRDDNTYPRVLTYLSLSAKNPRDDEVGRLIAVRIDREHCRGKFLEVMKESSRELQAFSAALFDKYGRLIYDLMDHEYLKGSGVWRREMDSGILLYVQSMEVQAAFRNADVASWMLDKLMQSEHADPSGYAICHPASIAEHAHGIELDAQHELAVNFFRENGFRRIGRTSFFGYTPNTAHPSRMLAASDDVPAHQQFVSQGLPSVSMQARAARYPVHAIITASVTPIVGLLDAVAHAAGLSGTAADIEPLIHAAYERDTASVRQRDDSGLSPLHLAAAVHSLRAVCALLALPRESGVHEDLSARDNADGDTPLEACERAARGEKEDRPPGEKWYGYPDDALRVALALRRAAGEEVGVAVDEYLEKRKWGCTCGQCVAGWLSPRMKFRLRVTAKALRDAMHTGMPTFAGSRPLSPDSYHGCLALEFIPPCLWRGLYKSFYRAYRLVFIAIAQVLEAYAEYCLPTARVVFGTMLFGGVQHHADKSSEGCGQFFFKKGGRVEYALDCVMHTAMAQSPLGNGGFERLTKDDGEWNALPKCANDLEFAMIRQQIGLNHARKWGPYSLGEDSEEEDEHMVVDADDNYLG